MPGVASRIVTNRRRQARYGWILGASIALSAMALALAPGLFRAAALQAPAPHAAAMSSQLVLAADLHLEASADTESNGFDPIAVLSANPTLDAGRSACVASIEQTLHGSFGFPAVPPLRGPPLA